MIGLGRMGSNMARRIASAGIEIAAWDLFRQRATDFAVVTNVTVTDSLESLLERLASPRVAWLMLPAGKATEDTLTLLAERLAPGDIVVDGGNAWYRDSQRRAAQLAQRSILFMDAGVSGGVWGLQEGYGLMTGGAPEAMRRVEPCLRALAPRARQGLGALRAGRCGSLRQDGPQRHRIRNDAGVCRGHCADAGQDRPAAERGADYGSLAARHGVRSWLLDLTAQFLANDQSLESIAPEWPIQAKDAGPRSSRSNWAFRRR
jgi:6-phosphogluconate dehydrogenase